MKILVTGHNGLIGTHLVKKLQSEFTVLTSSKNDDQSINVLDKSQLLDLERVDAVIHLAAKTSIANSISNPYDTYYTNMVGTLNILDYAVKKKLGMFSMLALTFTVSLNISLSMKIIRLDRIHHTIRVS